MNDNQNNENPFIYYLLKYSGILFAVNIASYIIFSGEMKHTSSSRGLLYGYVYEHTETYYNDDALLYIIIPMLVVSIIIFSYNLFKKKS